MTRSGDATTLTTVLLLLPVSTKRCPRVCGTAAATAAAAVLAPFPARARARAPASASAAAAEAAAIEDVRCSGTCSPLEAADWKIWFVRSTV